MSITGSFAILDAFFGFGRFLRRIAAVVFGWLTEDWRNGPLAMLAILAAAHIFIIDPGLREKRDGWRGKYAAENKAHNQTIADFVQASHEAEQRQEANVARVEAEQAQITERIEHDYQTRIAALHARAANIAERLRSGQTAIDTGTPGDVDLSGSGPPARGSVAATGDSGLSASAPSCDPMSLEQRVIASEQAIQLDALIDWNLEQLSVKTAPVMEPLP
ncbi:MAG: hypothetical protein KUG65_06000 [Sphingomonadaceae bacterium]|nr:hypothetical protein [Sphingomonadaceae bacterium]